MTVKPRTRRIALLGGLAAAVLVFVLLRGRGGTPAELVDAGPPTGTTLDPGGSGGSGSAGDIADFVAMTEERLATQEAMLLGFQDYLGELRGNVGDLEDFLKNAGATLNEDTWAWPEEDAAGATDPAPAGPLFPRLSGGSVEVEPGVFQPVSWFLRAVEPFASLFAGFRVGTPRPDGNYSQRRDPNDPGPGGQAPPASPGNRRASPVSAGYLRTPASVLAGLRPTGGGSGAGGLTLGRVVAATSGAARRGGLTVTPASRPLLRPPVNPEPGRPVRTTSRLIAE